MGPSFSIGIWRGMGLQVKHHTFFPICLNFQNNIFGIQYYYYSSSIVLTTFLFATDFLTQNVKRCPVEARHRKNAEIQPDTCAGLLVWKH